MILVLDDQQRKALLDEVTSELATQPPGADRVGLEVFKLLLQDSLPGKSAAPSHRFDDARFETVSQDESRNILYGHLGLGVDVVGTVRDEGGTVAYEQHPVVIPITGPYLPLSGPDCASLADAIAKAEPPLDELWQRIANDAKNKAIGPG